VIPVFGQVNFMTVRNRSFESQQIVANFANPFVA
jgi:hypothetical protein